MTRSPEEALEGNSFWSHPPEISGLVMGLVRQSSCPRARFRARPLMTSRACGLPLIEVLAGGARPKRPDAGAARLTRKGPGTRGHCPHETGGPDEHYGPKIKMLQGRAVCRGWALPCGSCKPGKRGIRCNRVWYSRHSHCYGVSLAIHGLAHAQAGKPPPPRRHLLRAAAPAPAPAPPPRQQPAEPPCACAPAAIRPPAGD
jgi:hypothetical protein